MSVRVRLLLQAMCALLVGGWIYITWRHEELLMFEWFRAMGLQEMVDAVQSMSLAARQPADWVRFSLPDGLWVYSFTCFMLALWNARLSLPNLPWIIAPAALAVLSEIAQVIGLLPGTFDLVDLGCYLLATGFALTHIKNWPTGRVYSISLRKNLC